jgi:hypothetical protein
MAKTLKLTTLSVLLAIGIAPAALAQSPQAQGMMGYGWGQGMMGPNGMMGPGMHGTMGYGMMGPGMMMGYGPVMDGQLAYLKAELGITDAQTQAWDDYVKALKGRTTTMQSMHASMMQAMQTGTALDRMQVHIQAMQSMLDSMKAIAPATEALYKVLTDDQKKKADPLLGTGCCML